MKRIQYLLGALLFMLPLAAGAEENDSVKVGSVIAEVV